MSAPGPPGAPKRRTSSHRPAVVIVAAEAEHSLKKPMPARSGTNGSMAMRPSARWTRNKKKTAVIAGRRSRERALDRDPLRRGRVERIASARRSRASPRGQMRLHDGGHAPQKAGDGRGRGAAVGAVPVIGHEAGGVGQVVEVA